MVVICVFDHEMCVFCQKSELFWDEQSKTV